MKTLHIYYNNGQPVEHVGVADADVPREARARFAATVDMIECLGYALTRKANGTIEEAVWVDRPTHYVCEQCGHAQVPAFSRCPGCNTSDMIVKRAAGWSYSTIIVDA